MANKPGSVAGPVINALKFLDRPLVLTGAYGREAKQTDWEAGKDFKIYQGPYCSIRDLSKFKDDGYSLLLFWNSKAEEVFSIEL